MTTNEEFKALNDRIFNQSLMGHPTSESDYSDDELELVLKELLHNSHELEGKDITLTVDNRNVKLKGTVKTQEERDYAESVVKLVHGVGDVKSEIIVKRNAGILPTDIGRHS